MEYKAETDKQLMEELERFACIATTSSDMMALVDTNFIYLIANKAYLAAFGLAKDKVVGRTMAEVFGEEFFNTIIKPHAKRCLAGAEVKYEDWFQYPVSGSQYMAVSYSPYIGEDKKIKGFVVNAKNITERKKVEEELESIFSLSPDMIAVCTTEGQFLKVNRTWEKILGYKTDEILKLGWAKLVHPDDVNSTNEEVERQLKGDSVVNFVNRFRCKDGTYKTFEWQATSSIKGIVYATARDITDRKKMTQKLISQKVSLENKTIALREVIAQIEVEKNRIKENMAKNIQEIIMPIFNKLRLKGESKKYIELCKKNLEQIGSAFLSEIRKRGKTLTPREIEICNMIKGGLSSKEIARLLNLSFQTVEKHRNNIRKKLALVKKGRNLQSYLQDL